MSLFGVSNTEGVEKLRYLASLRVKEIKQCTQSTFCLQQTWIADETLVLSTILTNYPIFVFIPELVIFCICRNFILVNMHFNFLCVTLTITSNVSFTWDTLSV